MTNFVFFFILEHTFIPLPYKKIIITVDIFLPRSATLDVYTPLPIFHENTVTAHCCKDGFPESMMNFEEGGGGAPATSSFSLYGIVLNYRALNQSYISSKRRILPI